MNPLTLAGSLVGVIVYVPLCIQILAGKVKQNFATWALWALIDGIAAASIMYQHGSYLLPLSYMIGASAAALAILKSKNFSWTRFETMVAFMVVACIVVWAVSGAYVATIASTTAGMIASVPLVIDCYKEPEKNPFFTYLGFLVANTLSMLGGREWSVIERLYSASFAVMCFLVVTLIARRFWRKPALSSETA